MRILKKMCTFAAVNVRNIHLLLKNKHIHEKDFLTFVGITNHVDGAT